MDIPNQRNFLERMKHEQKYFVNPNATSKAKTNYMPHIFYTTAFVLIILDVAHAWKFI